MRFSSGLTRLIAALYWTATWAVVLPHAHHADRNGGLRTGPPGFADGDRRPHAMSCGPATSTALAEPTNPEPTGRSAAAGLAVCREQPRCSSRRDGPESGIESAPADGTVQARIAGECWCQAVVKRAAPEQTSRIRIVAEPVAFVLLPGIPASRLRVLRCLLPRAPPHSAA